MIAPLLLSSIVSITGYNYNGILYRDTGNLGIYIVGNDKIYLTDWGYNFSDNLAYGYIPVFPDTCQYQIDDLVLYLSSDIVNGSNLLSSTVGNGVIGSNIYFKYCYSLFSTSMNCNVDYYYIYFYSYTRYIEESIVISGDDVGLSNLQFYDIEFFSYNDFIGFDNSNYVLSGKRNAQANNIVDGITEPLSLTKDLASNFLDGFTKLFYDNNQLTNLAWFSLVFLGIAIVFGMVNLSLSLIGKNTGVK